MSVNLTRRAVVGGLASSVALPAFAQNLTLPSSPVTLNFVDVAGNLALTQKAIEAYRDKNPKLVSHVTFTQGAGAGTARQDQGAAGRRPRRHRRRAHRHRRAVGRRRPEALDPDRLRLCRQAAEARRHLSARRGEDAGARLEPGRLHRVLPGRPGDGIHAGQGEAGADDGRRAARLGQGQSEPLHVCAAGQLRPRPHLHDGPALHPRRQGSARSEERLGQDLGLSQGARPVHRVLPGRHRRRP